MSRINAVFERTAKAGRPALVTYLCAGDPSLEESAGLLLAAADAGADILEVGVPFSDPTADGPSIQQASERALRGGATLGGVLEVVREVRSASDVPIVLFGYYNPILNFGEAALVSAAQAAGVDGLLVVDLLPEDSEVIRGPAIAHGLDYVPLLAPTSDASRESAVAQVATSFVYYVSLTGVTGAATAALGPAGERAAQLRERIDRPVAVGFGVKTADDVAAAGRLADGVIVGSALVDAVARATSVDGRRQAVTELVGSLATGAVRARAT